MPILKVVKVHRSDGDCHRHSELKCQFLNLFGLGCLLTLLEMFYFATCNIYGNEFLFPSLKT